ncbi:MAG: hypothetical protein ACK2TU_08075 [Anaerolineales bacterium]
MESHSNPSPYAKLPDILLLFSQMLTTGVYSTFFLTTYLTFEDAIFQQRLNFYYHSLTYIFLTGIIFFGLSLFYQYRNSPETKDDAEEEPPKKSKSSRLYLYFLAGLLIQIILYFLVAGFELLNFFMFLLAASSILGIARTFSVKSKYDSWNHPTTAGGIIEGTISLGTIAGLWAFAGTDLSRVFAWIILIILVFEILTLWARFRYLSRWSYLTQETLQMLLGSHIALFGVRFIFGLIMPLVYIVWVLFISNLSLLPIILMIFVGELSERILFFITAIDQTQITYKSNENISDNIGGE